MIEETQDLFDKLLQLTDFSEEEKIDLKEALIEHFNKHNPLSGGTSTSVPDGVVLSESMKKGIRKWMK